MEKLKEVSGKAVKYAARFGCVSIGIVYILVGLLAVLNSVGITQARADEEGTMTFMQESILGTIALWVILIGLVGYAIWRFVEAIGDPYKQGTGAKALTIRVGVAGSGLIYIGLAYLALEMLVNGESNGNDEMEKEATAWVLDIPGGAWLIGLFGLVTILVGLAQFYIAYKQIYNERLHTDELEKPTQTLITITGRTGYSARGVVLLLLGYFVMRAAIFKDPSEAKDTDDLFAELYAAVGGFWLMALVGAGTIAYGFFMFIYARYYKFHEGDEGLTP
jgi:hypothetical protein